MTSLLLVPHLLWAAALLLYAADSRSALPWYGRAAARVLFVTAFVTAAPSGYQLDLVAFTAAALFALWPSPAAPAPASVSAPASGDDRVVPGL